LLKEGADCSLVVSPEKTKLIFPMLLLVTDPTVELEDATPAEEPEPDRRSIQGTATCLPEPVVLASEPWLAEVACASVWPVVLGWVALLPAPLDVVVSVSALPVARCPAPVTEIIAKSTRPDIGLMITSLRVPSCWPEELVILAPSICEARICCCCPARPVALSPLEDC
jgi:hypothetical protein